MTSVKAKIPLVYILGSHHSGSTILDLLLGSHPNLWTLGEFDRLGSEFEANSLCGCGRPLQECPFWKRVLKETNCNAFTVDLFRSRRRMRVIQWDQLISLLRGTPTARWQEPIKCFGDREHELFSAVRGVASSERNEDIQWLVSSSKNLYRLFWLHSSGQFDIRVIHLTKDSRAYLYSMHRLGHRGIRQDSRSLARWSIQNSMALYLCRKCFDPQHYIHLRYEDVAANPESTMNHLTAWLEIAPTSQSDEAIYTYENHAVAGNPTRWRGGKIKLDEEWMKSSSKLQDFIVRTVTYPLAKKFGYINRN